MLSLLAKVVIAIGLARSLFQFYKMRRISDVLFFSFWLSLVGAFLNLVSPAYLMLPMALIITAGIQRQKDSVPARKSKNRLEAELFRVSEPKHPKELFRLLSDEEGAAVDPQEFINRIPEFADDFVEVTRELMNRKLDYSEESLQVVDEIISESWGDSRARLLEPVLITLGSYVGETLRRNLGGNWHHSEEQGYQLDRIKKPDISAYPFNEIRKRFAHGEDDSIASFYRALKQTIEKD